MKITKSEEYDLKIDEILWKIDNSREFLFKNLKKAVANFQELDENREILKKNVVKLNENRKKSIKITKILFGMRQLALELKWLFAKVPEKRRKSSKNYK